MAGSTGNNSRRLMTDINVTPLVDVVLVLLIIFMATAPLISRRALNINVPKAAHTETKATDTWQIQMDAERRLYVKGRLFSSEELQNELRLQYRLNPALHVSVSGDEQVPYGEVEALLDIVRSLGIKKVALEVRPKRS